LYLDSVVIVQREPWFISTKHNFADISFNGRMEINAMDDAQVLIVTDFGYATIHYWNNGFSLNVPAGYKIISGYGLWNFTGSFPRAYLPDYYIPTELGSGTTTPSEKLEVAGNIKASKLIDRENSGYYIDPAANSKISNITVTGAVATDRIEDTAGTPRIEFNTSSGSVIVYVG